MDPTTFDLALIVTTRPDAWVAEWARRCVIAGVPAGAITVLRDPVPAQLFDSWGRIVGAVSDRRHTHPNASALVVVDGPGGTGGTIALAEGVVTEDDFDAVLGLFPMEGPDTAVVVYRAGAAEPRRRHTGRVLRVDAGRDLPPTVFEDKGWPYAFQVGPSTMGALAQYDIWDPSVKIGRLVSTTGTPTSEQAAYRSVWCWSDSTLSAFPSTFKLLLDTAGTGALIGTNRWTFKDDAFPAASAGPSVSGYTAFSVKRGSANGTLVGHMWTTVISGTRHQIWSAIASEVDADGMYNGRASGLYFSQLSTQPAWDATWRWRDDTL